MKKYTIEYAQQIAIDRHGKCLSDEYINYSSKLKWACCNNHVWETSLAVVIKNGCWCPYCNAPVSETICRCYFDILFDKKFIKCRPNWLINDNGNKMELDGYCEELKLAFEYQGEQHYGKHKIWNKKDYQDIVKRDQCKLIKCKENNVVLIVVPYYIGLDKMGYYIVDECNKNNIIILNSDVLSRIDYRNFDIYKYSNRLEKIKKEAKDRGGECLSDKYINARSKLVFRCFEGHVWEATTDSIYKGCWCPICANKKRGKRINIRDIKLYAKNNNGLCLSDCVDNEKTNLQWRCHEGHIWIDSYKNVRYLKRWCPICDKKTENNIKIKQIVDAISKKNGILLSIDYKNAHSKLKFKCCKGHIWEATPNNILRGKWCPYCNNERKKLESKWTIEDMNLYAMNKNGKCLSDKYLNNRTKLKWQCCEGHEWLSSFNNLQKGRWCPFCGGSQQLNIKDMKRLAELKNGKCLSNEYKNNRTKLKWKCSKGHVWEAVPFSIKSGRWCSHQDCVKERKRNTYKGKADRCN